jgi:putative RecB family exonuclease
VLPLPGAGAVTGATGARETGVDGATDTDGVTAAALGVAAALGAGADGGAADPQPLTATTAAARAATTPVRATLPAGRRRFIAVTVAPHQPHHVARLAGVRTCYDRCAARNGARSRRPSGPSRKLSYPWPTVITMAQTECTPELVGAPEVPGPAAGEPEAPRRPALSPSRANDFKQCPLLYRFRAIDRLPEVPTSAQARGTLVHAVLERLFLLPAQDRTPEAAQALVAPAWQQLCTDDPRLPAALSGDETTAAVDVEGWLAGAAPMIDAYFALEDPRLLEPEARELHVEVELESGLLLRGYIDRVDGTGTDGTALRVIDYKTGSAPRPIAEARALFQMKFYALALLCLRGVMPTELRLMYLTGPEELRYTPDEGELRRFARTLDAIWAAIRTAGATGDFRPNPGRSCAWCGYKQLCPAWDGTPPPYPGWPADAPSPGPQ